MITMKIKNWNDFQHYKDRSPPWIKFHKKILDDFDFQCLPLASRALAPMLWLLASESVNGEFNGDVGFLSFRLRRPKLEIEEGLKHLIKKGFVIVCYQDDSDVIATCLQDDIPETETEKEKEKEKEKRDKERDKDKEVVTQAKPARFDPLAIELPECIKPEAWSDWIAYRRSRKLTVTEPTMIAQLKKLEGWWHDGHDPNAIIGTSIAQGWQGLFEPKKTHNHFPEKRQQVDNKALAKQIYAQMQQRNNGGVENDG